MKLLFDVVVFLAWVSVYLAAVSLIARYRRAKAHAMGPTRHTDYRADKDVTLRLVIFVLGAVMLLVGYLATRVMGQHV